MFVVSWQSWLKKIIAGSLLLTALCLVIIPSNNPSRIVTQASVQDNAESQKLKIATSIGEIETNLKNLNQNLQDSSVLKKSLQEQKESVEKEISDLELVITNSKLLLNQIDFSLQENLQEKNQLVVEIKLLLIEMQKQSNKSSLEQILASKNLASLMAGTFSLDRLQNKANNLLLKLEQNQKNLEEIKLTQTQALTQQQQLNFLLRSKRSGLVDLLEQYQGKEAEWTKLVNGLELQRKQREIELVNLDFSKAKDIQEGGKNVQTGNCWFEEVKNEQDIPSDFFVLPTDGFVTRFFDGCMHDGVDIANTINTNVVAVADGTVEKKGYSPTGYGNFIVLKHVLPTGRNVYSLYAHLNSQSFLSVGDAIGKGSLIGYMGSTGYSTGPHLHFMLISDSYEKTGNEGCRLGGSTHSLCYNPKLVLPF